MSCRCLWLLVVAAVAGCGSADEIAESQEAGSTETFNRHLVLLDEALEDGDALTAPEIQAFLDATPYGGRSVLAGHSSHDRTAAQAIAEAAAEHTINPLVLLTRLQLEQSLISKTSASQDRLDWAMGCGCPDYQNCMEAYRGFDKQVACAAERLRSYMTDLDEGGETIAGWRVGKGMKTLDGYTVVPKSQATAAIYTYTPWVSSAKDHVAIWRKLAAFVEYETPTPGDCPALTFPTEVTIQLRPDTALSAEHDGEVTCFLDSEQLIAPDGVTVYDASVKLSSHFRLSEFASVAASPHMLLDPALVAMLETMRIGLGSAISPKLTYHSPTALAASCGQQESPPGHCESDEISRGSAAMIDSPAGPAALLAAAAEAGAPSCWAEGDWVYVGVGSAMGCPRE